MTPGFFPWKALALDDACPPDWRDQDKVTYALPHLMALITEAAMDMATGPDAVAAFARANARYFRRTFGWKRMPGRDTIRRTLAGLPEDAMETWLAKVGPQLAAPASRTKRKPEHPPPLPVVALDGKTARRCRKDGMVAVHMLGAVDVALGLPLRQLEIGEKENEITRAVELVSRLALKGKVLTADAMHCQTRTAEAIHAGGGRYIQIVKGNQGGLHDGISQLFAADADASPWEKQEKAWTTQVARTNEKGHGRIESRELTVTTALPSKACWPHARQCLRVVRTRTVKGVTTREEAYGITDLGPEEVDAHGLLSSLRAHWGVESWHWQLDMDFREDEMRIQDRQGAANMCRFLRLALAILKRGRHGRSVRNERFACGTAQAATRYLRDSVRPEFAAVDHLVV